jgi:hypothetical protein
MKTNARAPVMPRIACLSPIIVFSSTSPEIVIEPDAENTSPSPHYSCGALAGTIVQCEPLRY